MLGGIVKMSAFIFLNDYLGKPVFANTCSETVLTKDPHPNPLVYEVNFNTAFL